MENCKHCKFWNRKKVVAPGGAGMCEKPTIENHKSVTKAEQVCPNFKKGKFLKKYVTFRTW